MPFALLLLSGLLAMHGLIGGHDPSALRHGQAAVMAAPTSLDHTTLDLVAPVTAQVAAGAVAEPAEPVSTTGAGGHPLLLCLAALTAAAAAAVWAAVAMAGRRSRLLPRQRLADAPRSRADRPVPPWHLTPSPYRLSVLRT